MPMSTPKRPNARGRTLLRLAGMVPIAFCVQAEADVDMARFHNAQPAIKRFIATAKPRLVGDQHFCVVTYPVGDGYAWVHWREGNQLIYWRGAADGPPDDTIAFSTRQLDLAKDVVATDEDIAGSTYLVSRKWVDDRLADCKARGKRYVFRGS